MSLRQVQIPVFRSPAGVVVSATVEFVLVDEAGMPAFATNVGLNEEVVGFARVVSGTAETTVSLTPNTELATLLGIPTWYAITVWQETIRETWQAQIDAGASVLPWQSLKAAGSPLPPDSIVYHLTKDWYTALLAASSPDASNPVATINDIATGALPTAEAGEDLLAGQPVRMDANSKLWRAETTAGKDEILGLCGSDTGATFAATFGGSQVSRSDWSTIVGSALLIPGSVYFLDPTAPGLITRTPPDSTNLVRVGRAQSTTILRAAVTAPIGLT